MIGVARRPQGMEAATDLCERLAVSREGHSRPRLETAVSANDERRRHRTPPETELDAEPIVHDGSGVATT